MEGRGAFPGWLSRLWWLLLPGVLVVAAVGLRISAYMLGEPPEQRATGLGAVAGGFGMDAVWVVASWLLVSLALMHLWFFIALGFTLRREPQLQRRERWKLAGTVVSLLAFYSPLLLVIMVQFGLALRRLAD